jgi:4-amino-4-deoxy-L-arabinose transferase-like glycosyltransferase
VGYLLTAVVIAAVWRLARLMVGPRDALLAALSLEGVLFFTFWGGEKLNHNLALTPCWVLTACFLYRAMQKGRLRDWMAAGAFAGLGLLAKYPMILLLVPLLGWSILAPRALRHWRRPGPYLALLTMAAVFGPHLAWSAAHGWPTLAYAHESAAMPRQGTLDLLDPVLFLALQAAALLPLGMVLLRALRRRHMRLSTGQRSAVAYLAVMIFGPLTLWLVLGVGLGVHLDASWGTPLWTVLGLFLLLLWPLGANVGRWVGLGLVGCNLAALALLTGHTTLGGKLSKSRIHFPGATLAAEADRVWRARQPGSVPAVAGECWLAGNIGLFAPGRPCVCYSADPEQAEPWFRYSAQADDARLRRSGGLLVWRAGQWQPVLPPLLAQRFPDAMPLRVIEIGNDGLLCGFAIIPPADGAVTGKECSVLSTEY